MFVSGKEFEMLKVKVDYLEKRLSELEKDVDKNTSITSTKRRMSR